MKRKLWICALVFAMFFSGCSYMEEPISLQNLLGIQQKNENHPQIATAKELRDYVLQQRQQGKLEFSFTYTGTNEIDPGVIAQIADVCYVKMTIEGDNYHLEMTQFPGERIVKAYASDDTAKLTKDEQKALEIALEMVEQAKDSAADDWELELLIHDMLAERITYCDADIHYEDPEDQPRHLSVIGALLDGQANCQGYTDAFYTLATLAGFEVGRLSVETDSNPHMVNLICLNDAWYVVDLTYDDANDDAISYQLLNAGLDLIGKEYFWSDEIESNFVVEKSDENSYYLRKELVFADLYELAAFIAQDWAENGNTEIHTMLQNEPNSEKLNDVLPDALSKWERSYSYSILHSSNGKDSFYTIIFE